MGQSACVGALGFTRLPQASHSRVPKVFTTSRWDASLYAADGPGPIVCWLTMARKILCVAEKPAIARAVATHMSGGSFQTVSIPHITMDSG